MNKRTSTRVRIKIDHYDWREEGSVLLMYRGLYDDLYMPFRHAFVAPQTYEQRAVCELVRDLWFPAKLLKNGNERQL